MEAATQRQAYNTCTNNITGDVKPARETLEKILLTRNKCGKKINFNDRVKASHNNLCNDIHIHNNTYTQCCANFKPNFNLKKMMHLVSIAEKYTACIAYQVFSVPGF